MWIAERLNERGIALREVRVIPDIEDTIIDAVDALRHSFDYVFTTGGIGPTHDDITAASIAKAFGIELEKNEKAFKMLEDHYGLTELTPARAKMSMIPKNARLIPNPVSAAPGFIVENVHVMAGVPRIMHAMLDHVLSDLEGGVPFLSNTITCGLPESELSEELETLQEDFPDVNIGSYPHYRGGRFGLSIVMRSEKKKQLEKVSKALIKIMRDHGEEPRAISMQAPVKL